MAPRSMWYTIKMLAPFLWPKGEQMLQLRVVCCLALLGIIRLITVGVPVIYKKLIDHMTESANSAQERVSKGEPMEGFYIESSHLVMILVYVSTKSMVGSYGYLNVLRSYLWVPVSLRTHKSLRVALFTHILNLSLAWHLRRKTGEVLRVVDRGVTSVEHVLNEVVFSMIPAVADVAISLMFFMSFFDLLTGFAVAVTMIGYVSCSLVLTKWKYGYRRDRNTADNVRQAAIVDAILNFETVKYHAAEAWEVQRYNDALEKHMQVEWLVNMASELRWCARRTMMSIGLAIGSVLCAVYVNQGTFTVGDYVLFVSYLEQVYVPLNSIGDYYKRMQQATIDMEHMFDILEEQPDIVDASDAKELQVSGGRIEFQSVSFGYVPERPLLQDLSWCIEPGQTLAIVGQSGSGKSTILRLLLRFYDVQSGAVLIDGQNVRSVTQHSLRQVIGVVPQDTVLFNKDIEYNIRYGRPEASDEEVVEAALSANIHRRILSFTDGYSTKVGERGLKLSGGEKQRVAIARTVLKRAKIIVLDEATSALDTKTERKIQTAIARVCKGKTTIIVAHRLSTIVHADVILVLENGKIIERGTHEQLVEAGGRYAEMWSEQLRRRSEEDGFEEAVDADDENWTESTGFDESEENEFGSATLLRKRKTVIVEDGIRMIPKV